MAIITTMNLLPLDGILNMPFFALYIYMAITFLLCYVGNF